MLAVAAVPAVALLFGMLRMPESSRWLMSKGRSDEALKMLRQVRPADRAQAEMEEVHRLAELEEEAHVGGWSSLRQGWIRRLVFSGIGLAVAQQLTGINSIMYYGTQVLIEAGYSQSGALIANTANGAISVIAMLVVLHMVTKFGRRTLLLAGFTGTTTMHLLIGVSSMILPPGGVRATVILVLIVLFLACMQSTLGLIVWIMLAEIFPLKIRGFAIGLSVLCMWVPNGVLSLFFPSLVAGVGISGTFFLFAVLGVAALIFIATQVPETRGRSLEQLEKDFSTGAIYVVNKAS